MSNNKSILFYSKKCEYCQKLIEMGKSKNKLDQYILINLDNKEAYAYPIPITIAQHTMAKHMIKLLTIYSNQ